MKVIDVHPEDLLDREARGALSDDQRVLLNAHLAHCQSCRMERLLRSDFAAEAVRMNEADMQSFVLGALQRAASGEAAVNTSFASAPQTSSRRRLAAVVALTGVLLVAAGAAASRSGWAQRVFRVAFGETTIEQPQAARGKRARSAEKRESAAPQESGLSATRVAVPASARSAAPQGVREAQAHDEERVPGPALNGRPNAERAPGVTRPAKVASERKLENTYRRAPRTARITNVRVAKQPLAAPDSDARLAEPPTAQADPPSASPPPDPARLAAQAAAAALFEQANRARRSGKIDEAARLYMNLQREFAASAEARLSHAISARMALDAGHAAAALAGFERYLSSDERALREEAMTGRALALAKLGRHAAADLAFAELLKVYPDSSYAPLAKKRLGQD